MEVFNTETLALLLTHKKVKELRFRFQELSEKENSTWQKEISRDYFSCGCSTGSIFLTLGVLAMVSVITWAFIQDRTEYLSLRNFLLAFAILFLLAGIGKGLGLLIARYRLKKNINYLLKTMRA